MLSANNVKTGSRFRSNAIWLYVIAIIAVMGMLLGLRCYADYRREARLLEERLMAQARVVDETINANLYTVSLTLENIIQELEKNPALRPGQLNNHLKMQDELVPGIRTILVTDRQGICIHSSREVLVGQNFSARDYFRSPQASHGSGRLFMSPPFKTILGSYVLNISKPILGRRNEFKGVISVALEPDYFKSLLKSTIYAPDNRIALVHSDGTVFTAIPDGTGSIIGQNLSKPGSLFFRHRQEGRPVSIQQGRSATTGDKRVFAYITNSPSQLRLDKHLVVAASRNLADVLAPWKTASAIELALYLLFALSTILVTRRMLQGNAELAQTAADLRQSEERLQQMFKAHGAVMLLINPETGAIIDANLSAETFYGYSRDALLKINIADLNTLAPDEIRLEMQHAKQQQRSYFVFKHKLSTGAIITVEVYSSPITVQGKVLLFSIIHDITDRKRVEDELSESKQQLANIIDFLPDATFVIDNDMKVIAWNRAMEEMSGVSKEEMLGQGDHAYAVPFYGEKRRQLLDLIDISDAELEAKYQSVQRKGEVLNAEVFTPALYGGKGAYIWVSGSPLYSTGNKRVGAIEILRDVSERKKVEGELQQATLAAESANRAKSEFLANMSHEIRTPMNAITGMAYLALQTDLDLRQRELVERIRSASDSLLGIINDILDFSKIEAGKMELESVCFRLRDVFNSVGNLIAAKAGDKNLELRFTTAPGTPDMLIGDPLRLGQILNNLVSNAIKFTEKGHIAVAVAVAAAAHPERIALTFSVADTGIGMDSEHLERIFTPFTQADSSITRRFGGTGLGLSIISRLLELMNSGLTVNSTPGRGSTFSFTVEFGVPPDYSYQPADPPDDLKNMRILVVDDSPDVGLMLVSMLNELSFRPLAVNSGAEALKELERAAAADGESPYRLVLLDWRMPDMDGLETARRIRTELRLNPSPEIIIISGYIATAIKEQAQELGIRIFLNKPLLMPTLYKAVMEACGREPGADIASGNSSRPVAADVKQLRGLRVLLAEDNPVNQIVAQELLKRFGAEVVTTGNGLEAVEAVSANGPFDMVFMDIQMPVMNGYEAASAIRKIKGDLELPIIAMTARAFSEERRHCLAAGMNDHVAKPVDPDQLYSVMLRWMRPEKVIGSSSQSASCAGDERELFPENLPGIDCAAVLKRCGANRALARDIMVSFRDLNRTVAADIRTGIAGGDSAQTKFLVHNLKGLSATVGAASLAATLAELETALKAGAGDKYPAMLAVMETQLQEIFAAADSLDQAAPGIVPETPELLPPPELALLLGELHDSLLDNDLGAARLFERLKNQLRSPEREEIGKAIARLDFDKALLALEQVAQSYGIELHRGEHG
jgi:PAS domain S-box-containing protein